MKSISALFILLFLVFSLEVSVYAQGNEWATLELLKQDELEVAKRAVIDAEKTRGPNHPSVAPCIDNLASLYMGQQQYDQVEPLYKRSLVIRKKALSPNHPDVAMSLNNLAGLYSAQGRYAEAEPLHKRSVTINEKAPTRWVEGIADCVITPNWAGWQAAPAQARTRARNWSNIVAA